MIEYRPVENFPAYRVGTDGSLWSRWKRKQFSGYVLSDEWTQLDTPGRDRDGYVKVLLYAADGKRRSTRLHTLVLETFRGPHGPNEVGCHNDGIKTHNWLDNLRWDVQAENIRDKIKHGTRQAGDKSSKHLLTEAQVAEIRTRRKAGERNCDLAKEFGVSPKTTSAAYVGRNWQVVH